MTYGHVIGASYAVLLGLFVFIGVTHNHYHDQCNADCYCEEPD